MIIIEFAQNEPGFFHGFSSSLYAVVTSCSNVEGSIEGGLNGTSFCGFGINVGVSG